MEFFRVKSALSNTFQKSIDNPQNSSLTKSIYQKTKITSIPHLSPISKKNSVYSTIIDNQYNKPPNQSKFLHDFVGIKKTTCNNSSNKMNINDLEIKLKSILINSKAIKSIFENGTEPLEKSKKYIYHRKAVSSNLNSSKKRNSPSLSYNNKKNKINNIFLTSDNDSKILFSNKSENKKINIKLNSEYKDITLKEFLGEQIKQIKNKNGHFKSITNIQKYNNNLYKKNLDINTYSIDNIENNLNDSLNEERNTSTDIDNNNINNNILNIKTTNVNINSHQIKESKKLKKLNSTNINTNKNKQLFNFPQNFISYKEFTKIPLVNSRNKLKINNCVNKTTIQNKSQRKNTNKIDNTKLILKEVNKIKKNDVKNNNQHSLLNSKKNSNKIIIPTPNKKPIIENYKSKNIKNEIFIKNNYNSNNSDSDINAQESTKVSFAEKNINKNIDNFTKIPKNSLKKSINSNHKCVERKNNSKLKFLNSSNVENSDNNKNSFSFVDVKLRSIPKSNSFINTNNKYFCKNSKH